MHAPAYEVWAAQLRGRALHHALANTFADEALTQAYLDHERSLRRLASTEGRVEVEDIRYGQIAILEKGWQWAMVEAEWEVSGTIRHGTGEQMHAHRRTNAYQAVYRLVAVGDEIRIVDWQLRDLRRLEVGPREEPTSELVNPLDMLPRGGAQ